MQETNIILVPEERLNSYEQKLDKLEAILEEKQEQEFLNRWIEGSKVPDLLNISNRTWQKWRNQKVIPFSQYGRQIWVKLADIEAFLLKNHLKKAA